MGIESRAPSDGAWGLKDIRLRAQISGGQAERRVGCLVGLEAPSKQLCLLLSKAVEDKSGQAGNRGTGVRSLHSRVLFNGAWGKVRFTARGRDDVGDGAERE